MFEKFVGLFDGSEMLGKCVVCDEWSVYIDGGMGVCMGCNGDDREIDMLGDEMDELLGENENDNGLIGKKMSEMVGLDDVYEDDLEKRYWMIVYRRLDCEELKVVYMNESKKNVWNVMLDMYSEYVREIDFKVGEEMKVEIVGGYWIRVEDSFEYVLDYCEVEKEIGF